MLLNYIYLAFYTSVNFCVCVFIMSAFGWTEDHSLGNCKKCGCEASSVVLLLHILKRMINIRIYWKGGQIVIFGKSGRYEKRLLLLPLCFFIYLVLVSQPTVQHSESDVNCYTN